MNDRADVAHATGSDVLHLGQGDLPVPAARAILGDEVLIGRSTHAEAEVDAAVAEPGVDYFCTGPCWPTPTKPGRHAPGLGLVRYAAALAHRTAPWFAIGGIDAGNLDEVLDAGARRVVVVRAITEADDPAAAAAALAKRVRERDGSRAAQRRVRLDACPQGWTASPTRSGHIPASGWAPPSRWLTCTYGPWHSFHQDGPRTHRA